MLTIKGRVLYRFKKEEIPGEVSDPKKYKYCFCDEDWKSSYIMADMWVCDAEGRKDPGLNISPIPVRRESIEKAVRRLSPEIENPSTEMSTEIGVRRFYR